MQKKFFYEKHRNKNRVYYAVKIESQYFNTNVHSKNILCSVIM